MAGKLEDNHARVNAAVALTEGDRVPFAPKFGYVSYVQASGISMYEGLMGLRNMKPGMAQFLTK